MSCSICTETKPIPTCVDKLIIGVIEDINTDVSIYIKNNVTGRIQKVDTTSDGSGEVTLNLINPDKAFYSQNFDYELWITLKDESINDKLDITIGYAVNDCFILRFVDIYEDLDKADFTTHTLEIDT